MSIKDSYHRSRKGVMIKRRKKAGWRFNKMDEAGPEGAHLGRKLGSTGKWLKRVDRRKERHSPIEEI